MQKFNKVIQSQIEEATRDKYGRVKVVDAAKVSSFGRPDFSSQPATPTILWRLEEYRFPLAYPTFDDVKFALSGNQRLNKRITVIPGVLNGGFTSSLYTNKQNVSGTQLFTTKIMSLSTRAFNSKFAFETSIIETGTVFSPMFMVVCAKSDDSTGTYPDWTLLAQSGGIGYFNDFRNFTINLKANDWVTLAFYLYGGYPFSVNITEAFKGLALSLDSWRLIEDAPPDPPEWGSTPITSDYLDESIGTSVNTLTIKTPSEDDWLGVGIYRYSSNSNTDIQDGGDRGHTIVRANAANTTDFGRDYNWNIYGATSQPYVFVREDLYQKNLITNGTFRYDSQGWVLYSGGPSSSDVVKLVNYEPYYGSWCVKSSANYSGASKYDMYAEATAFAVDITRDYIVLWRTKNEGATAYSHATSKSISAVQVSYYKSATHTPCVSTPYQLMPWMFQSRVWEPHQTTLYSPMSVSSFNPSGATGASALGYFIVPSDCTHAQVKIKFSHDSSAKSVIYFDGADIEVSSGQSITYHDRTSDGTTLQTKDRLTLGESTAYGLFRFPFRGRHSEVYFGHSADAYGDKLYLSSSHWAKFAQGYEIGIDAYNRVKNGNFSAWTAGVPTNWGKFGTTPPRIIQASTAVYGTTSMGLLWPSSADPLAGGGIWQSWGGGSNKPEITYSFWLWLDTGAIKIGDLNGGAIDYKEPHALWYATYDRGIFDSGPPHLTSNTVVVPKGAWSYQTMHLASAWGFHIWSDVPGTKCYVDGVQVNYNTQSDGTVRNFPTLFDQVRYGGQGTAKAASYVLASTNSLDVNKHTIRCWYTPAHNWYLKSTATGDYQMPRSVIWSWGEDNAGDTTDRAWLSYVPFRNADSSGGYFQYYAQSNNAVNTMVIPGARYEFKAFEPIHLVVTYMDSSEGVTNRQRFNKLYVNGTLTTSSYGLETHGSGAFTGTWARIPKNDNMAIGAMLGAETTTAFSFTGYDATTAYGHANGIISELRIDNYIWSDEQVVQDLQGDLPRMAPSATLTNIQYQHIADKIRDGSERNTFTYEDFGVSAGAYYSYTLDAFDYGGNRSIFGSTAGVVAGDTIAPGEVTDTGYSASKGSNLIVYWKNPTDADFSHNRVYLGGKGTALATIYSTPGAYAAYFAGFVGYGANKYYIVTAVDKHANESVGRGVVGLTKRGNIVMADGSIFTNVAGGLVDGLPTLPSSNAFSWGKIYYTVTNPYAPNYADMQIRILTEDSAFGAVKTLPVKIGSATGLNLDTSYYLYLTDSANGRTDALRMEYNLDPDIASSITAYPLGRFYTGNTTVIGYFTPHADVAQFSQGFSLISPRIESQSGKTYFDLQNAILHTENDAGDYTEIAGLNVIRYKQDVNKYFNVPIIKYIPASSVNAGVDNLFSNWGLGAFNAVPDVMLIPANVRTYSTTLPDFGTAHPQYLSLSVDVQQATATPHVRLISSGVQIENQYYGQITKPDLHTTVAVPWPCQPCISNTLQVISGVATSCAWGSATGTGPSGIGANDSTSIARVDIDLNWFSSADGRTKHHICLRFFTLYCSANADMYQDHTGPNVGVFNLHQREYHEHKFTTTDKRDGHSLTFSKSFGTAAPYKPMIKFFYASAEPAAYSTQDINDITWTGVYASSGGEYIQNLVVTKITYYTQEGAVLEQTGYGLVSALVMGV